MTRPDAPTLESWIEDCVASLRDAESFDVLAPHKDEFWLLYGIAARTMRFSAAYLQLVHSGFAGEAVVLARAALEHAVTLQWIFIVEGGVDRFRIEVAHDRIEHYGNLSEWLNDQDLAEAVTALDVPPTGKRLSPFMNMLRELDKEKFLEASYHVLSQQVHVTHSAVTSFVATGVDDLQVQYDQEYGYQYQATYVVAASCMLTRWVVATLTNDTELLRVLDSTSDDLILPMNLIDSVPEKKRRKGLAEPI